jgi:FtsH-binding integral membrane protein
MLHSLLAPVDLYCERTDATLWSEPVNILTNLAFIIAGLLGVAVARRERAGLFAEVLGWWIVAVGLGSTLFHVFANRMMVAADVLPIATLTVAATIFVLRRMFAFSWSRTLVVALAYLVVAGVITLLLPDWLKVNSHGSSYYFPPLLGLGLFGGALASRGHPAGRYFLVAFAIFGMSLFCRSIDEPICAAFPLGTHFLWHLLNGIMLGVVIYAMARFGYPAGAVPGARAR